jgi:hypothetical protein
MRLRNEYLAGHAQQTESSCAAAFSPEVSEDLAERARRIALWWFELDDVRTLTDAL